MDSEEGKWYDKIHVSKDVIELIYYLVTLLTTLVGLGLAFIQQSWPILFVGIGLAATIAFFIYSKEGQRRQGCLNPDLIIERDDVFVKVSKTRRFVEREISLKARKAVRDYTFKFFWTGSSQDAVIECKDNPLHTVMQPSTPSQSQALPWQLRIVRFEKPLKPGERTKIVLAYTLPDPKGKAGNYQLFAYSNVWQCREFRCRLTFAEGLQPATVSYFSEDPQGITHPRRKIPFDPQHGAYTIVEKPRRGHKYALEWDYTKPSKHAS